MFLEIDPTKGKLILPCKIPIWIFFWVHDMNTFSTLSEIFGFVYFCLFPRIQSNDFCFHVVLSNIQFVNQKNKTFPKLKTFPSPPAKLGWGIRSPPCLRNKQECLCRQDANYIYSLLCAKSEATNKIIEEDISLPAFTTTSIKSFLFMTVKQWRYVHLMKSFMQFLIE